MQSPRPASSVESALSAQFLLRQGSPERRTRRDAAARGRRGLPARASRASVPGAGLRSARAKLSRTASAAPPGPPAPPPPPPGLLLSVSPKAALDPRGGRTPPWAPGCRRGNGKLGRHRGFPAPLPRALSSRASPPRSPSLPQARRARWLGRLSTPPAIAGFAGHCHPLASWPGVSRHPVPFRM